VSEPRRNIEIKCRCRNLEEVHRRALAIGAREAGLLEQRDTFFGGSRARLKLRELGAGRAELISYQRPDVAGPRASAYRVAPVAHAAELAAVLEQALGTAGGVAKRRTLLLLRSTRIHLDVVEGLGTFVELETVLSGQPDEDGERELAEIAAALGLEKTDQVASPYVDLLSAASPLRWGVEGHRGGRGPGVNPGPGGRR
jgi:predicted adenylyl cyclase CyaB